MLIESTAHLPISLAMFQEVFHSPDGASIGRMILRWSHFVAGITWIGLLYFFNLVNVPFQKGIDADTKKKVNPDLLGRALWYFRWGALITVLAGLTYYAMYILAVDVRNANTLSGGRGSISIAISVQPRITPWAPRAASSPINCARRVRDASRTMPRHSSS